MSHLYGTEHIPFNRAADGTGWATAEVPLGPGDALTVTGTDAVKPGGTPRRVIKTFNGPGILTLYRAPNGDLRWFSNALEVTA